MEDYIRRKLHEIFDKSIPLGLKYRQIRNLKEEFVDYDEVDEIISRIFETDLRFQPFVYAERKLLKAITERNYNRVGELLTVYEHFPFEKILEKAVEESSPEIVRLLLQDPRSDLDINNVAIDVTSFGFSRENVSIILSDPRINNETLLVIVENSLLGDNFEILDLVIKKTRFESGELKELVETFIEDEKAIKYLVKCLSRVQDPQEIMDIAEFIAINGTNEMFLNILETPSVTENMLFQLKYTISEKNQELLDLADSFGRENIRKAWYYIKLAEELEELEDNMFYFENQVRNVKSFAVFEIMSGIVKNKMYKLRKELGN